MLGWGVIASTLGLLVLTNLHGMAERGAKMARFGRPLDSQDLEDLLRNYRISAGVFVVLGVAVIVYAISGLL